MTEHRIRILIAEDHLIARVGVKTIINAQPDMQVVAEAANGLQAVELFRKHRPDVSLMDVRMPEMSGVEATQAIRAAFPEAHIIAISTYGGDEDVRGGNVLPPGGEVLAHPGLAKAELVETLDL